MSAKRRMMAYTRRAKDIRAEADKCLCGHPRGGHKLTNQCRRTTCLYPHCYCNLYQKECDIP